MSRRTKRIGKEGADWCNERVTALAVEEAFGIEIPRQPRHQSAIGNFGILQGLRPPVPPKPQGLSSGSGGVFPLCFIGQTILFAGESFEPLYVGDRVVVTNTNDGVIIGLLGTRVAPVAVFTKFVVPMAFVVGFKRPGFVCGVMAGFRDKDGELGAGHRV